MLVLKLVMAFACLAAAQQDLTYLLKPFTGLYTDVPADNYTLQFNITSSVPDYDKSPYSCSLTWDSTPATCWTKCTGYFESEFSARITPGSFDAITKFSVDIIQDDIADYQTLFNATFPIVDDNVNYGCSYSPYSISCVGEGFNQTAQSVQRYVYEKC